MGVKLHKESAVIGFQDKVREAGLVGLFVLNDPPNGTR